MIVYRKLSVLGGGTYPAPCNQVFRIPNEQALEKFLSLLLDSGYIHNRWSCICVAGAPVPLWFLRQ